MNGKLKRLTPVQLIVILYFTAILISTILLSLPIAHRPGVQLHFLDALFTASSAVSVTGLTVVNTAETFSPVGITFLLVILHFGGIGFMTLGTFLWLATGQRIGIQRRQMIMVDQNQTDLSGLVRLMKNILFLSLLIEAVGALVLGLYYYWVYGYSTADALLFGVFSSVSAFTNAGFDIFGNSLFRFSGDYFVQSVTILLLIAGGIGFPVLVEAKEWLFASDRRRFRFSLFTKVTVTTYFLLLAFGVITLWLLESDRFHAGMSWHQTFFYTLFNSVTTRNGGLATMDLNEYSLPSQLVICFLMFTGASPSSVGGGIRTTTLAVVILTVISYARGQNHVRLFRREFLDTDVKKAAIVFVTAVMLVSLSTILLAVEQPGAPFNQVLFEVCSAFGTTGLSLGITPDLTQPGKWTILTLMFVGRIGILSLLFLMRNPTSPDVYRYPRERVIIG
ncbi:TrkH family potassium uptake protein [Salinithrix halophila]|uniref:TrkH family potassium uptake protein n=1 Tax=Salinithrix halophila TaxID=1485204 RepID=A0ABV8J9S1_9BACL